MGWPSEGAGPCRGWTRLDVLEGTLTWLELRQCCGPQHPQAAGLTLPCGWILGGGMSKEPALKFRDSDPPGTYINHLGSWTHRESSELLDSLPLWGIPPYFQAICYFPDIH